MVSSRLPSLGISLLALAAATSLAKGADDWHVSATCRTERAGEFGRGLYEISIRHLPIRQNMMERIVRIRGCGENADFEHEVLINGDYSVVEVQAVPLTTPYRQTDFLLGLLWEDGPPNDYILIREEDGYRQRTFLTSNSYLLFDDRDENGIWSLWLPVGAKVSCGARAGHEPYVVEGTADVLDIHYCAKFAVNPVDLPHDP